MTRRVRLLGVSRSGFYAWLNRVPSKRAIRAERIEAKVAWFHGDSDQVSGTPKILADLRGDGEVISRKTGGPDGVGDTGIECEHGVLLLF